MVSEQNTSYLLPIEITENRHYKSGMLNVPTFCLFKWKPHISELMKSNLKTERCLNSWSKTKTYMSVFKQSLNRLLWHFVNNFWHFSPLYISATSIRIHWLHYQIYRRETINMFDALIHVCFYIRVFLLSVEPFVQYQNTWNMSVFWVSRDHCGTYSSNYYSIYQTMEFIIHAGPLNTLINEAA